MSSGALHSEAVRVSSTRIVYGDVEVLSACPVCGADRMSVLDSAANLCECLGCGYVFDNPRPTLSALIHFYSQPAKYDSWLAEEHARDALWTRRLRKLLPLAKPGSLLDVGAGIGQFLALARPCFTEVYGTEVSESAIRIARNKYGLPLYPGEIQDISFGDKQFDNITIFHVLEHVPDPRCVVEKCTSLLSRGGVLVIAVPNDLYTVRGRRFLKTITNRMFHHSRALGLPKIVLDGSVAEIHLSHFTPTVLRRLLEQCGLKVIANTLDPYYAATGFAHFKHAVFYAGCRALHGVLRVNVYDTMLLVARKSS
jgi:2-polyprenyl-3-methyl-5-hydroxy-6-metoxy-1,4-benzoquinol methylase/rubredoxin